MGKTLHIGAISILVFLAACSKAERDSSSEAQDQPAVQMEEADRAEVSAAPGISVTAAPGVAFNYRYAFRLNATAVAGVQEEHAQLCEKLGLDRCRITGMRYRLVNDRDISAMLAFKLDPGIARQFGKQAIAVVNKSKGMLIDSEISGEDVGTAIEQSKKQQARLENDLATIEKRLSQSGVGASERAELQRQADELRRSRRATQDIREHNQAALATTPMVFNYGSGDLVPGFDGSSTLRSAFETAAGNFVGALNVLIIIFGTILPWVLIGTALFLAIRRITPWLDRLATGRRSEEGEA